MKKRNKIEKVAINIKILFSMMICVVLTAIVCTAVLYFSYNQVIIGQIANNIEDNVQQVQVTAKIVDEIVGNISNNISNSKQIEVLALSKEPKFADELKGFEYISQYRYSIPYIDSIYFYHSLADIFYVVTDAENKMKVRTSELSDVIATQFTNNIINLGVIEDARLLREINSSRTSTNYQTIIRAIPQKGYSENAKYVITAYKNIPSSGFVMVNASINWMISGILKNSLYAYKTNILLIDPKGYIISNTTDVLNNDNKNLDYLVDYVTSEYKKAPQNTITNMEIDGQRYLLHYLYNETYDWLCVGLVEYYPLIEGLNEARLRSIAISLSVMGMGLLLAIYLSNILNKPLIKLNQKMASLENKINVNEDQIKNRLLKKMLDLPGNNENETIKNFIETYNINLNIDLPIIVAVLLIDNFDDYMIKYDMSARRSIKSGISMIIKEHLKEYGYFEVIDYDINSTAIIINLQKESEGSIKTEDSVSILFEDIKERIKEYLLMSCTIGCSQINSIIELNKSYTQALDTSKYRYIYGKGKTLMYSQLHTKKTSSYKYLEEKEKAVFQAFYNGDSIIAEENFRSIMKYLKEYSIVTINMTLSRIVYEMHLLIEKINQNQTIILPLEQDRLIAVFDKYETMDDMIDDFILALRVCCLKIKESKNYGNDWLAEKVTKIIQIHFTDPEISVEKIAEKIGYSSAHVGRVYKTHNGYTVSQKILDMRMWYAIELLKDTNIKIGDLYYKCGLNSSSYFSKVFKKYYGVSPKDYRHSIINQ